jgi:transcriptional regulator with XRE-family HTH domain
MPQDPRVDFGSSLRQARERCGVSLREIANVTKISLPALEALERNDVSHLPGGIFSRAFVRAYAREVGLDPEETVKSFIASFPGQDPSEGDGPLKTAARSDVRVDLGTGVMGTVVRVVTVVAGIAVVVGYLAWSGRLASWRGGTAAPPAASTPAPAPAAALNTPAAPDLPLEETVAVKAADQPGAALIADKPPSGAAGVPAQEMPAPAAAAELASLPEGTLRLALSARGRCWVSLRADGIHVFAGTMEAGDDRAVDVKGRISLTVGDAGVFSYSINGMPARPMGESGETATVVITVQNYKSFLQ